MDKDKNKNLLDSKQSIQQALSILKLLESDMSMHGAEETYVDTVRIAEELLKKTL